MNGVADVDVRKVERDRRQLEVRLVGIEDHTVGMFGSKTGFYLSNNGARDCCHEIEGELQSFFTLPNAELLLRHLCISERQVLVANRKKAQPRGQGACLYVGY